eukprot:scaffold13904_cov129-Ochromonas_danica.AAC.1
MAEKERASRDETMREEGRRQERERKLLEGLNDLPVLEGNVASAGGGGGGGYLFSEEVQRRTVFPPLPALQRAVDNGLLTYEESLRRVADVRRREEGRLRLVEAIYNGTVPPAAHANGRGG